MKRVLSFCACCMIALSAVTAGAAENLNFVQKRMTAGKASLTENGFIINRVLGTANFSPELRFPVQLVYNSASDKTGLLGYGWNIPQLESSAIPQPDGVKWTSPWGEKIRFFTKEAPTPKDVAKAREEIDRNNYFVDGFLEWKAEGQVKKGDWKFSGIRDYEGWEIIYKDALLSSVKSPKGNKIEFSYQGKRPLSISQNGEKFIEIKYDGQCISEITINGIRHLLAYNTGKVVRLPEVLIGKSIEFSRPRLSSIKTGDLAPLEFSYDKQSFLSSIKQGGFTEELLVENESEQERKDYFKAEEKRLNARLMGVRAERTKVSGRLIKDANFTYSYPRSGNPGIVTLTNKLNQKAEFDYNVREGSFAVSGFNGIKSTIYYYMRHDVAYHGKVRQVMDAQRKSLVKYNYDKDSGKVLNITDMMNNKTYYNYDKDQNLILISRSEEDIDKRPLVSIKYDQKNNPVQYDTLDRKGKSVYTTKLSYSKDQEIDGITTEEGFIKFHYNTFGYPISSSDTFKREIHRNYDKFNRMISQITPENVLINYFYDNNSQIASIEKYSSSDKKELLSSVKFSYDKMGQIVSVADNSGKVKKFDRDAEGRITAEYFPDNSVVKYSFDKLGNLSKVIDQNGNPIEFSYNKFGKLENRTNAEGQLVVYDYDKFGLSESIVKKFVKDENPTQEIKYSYDKFDRVVKIDYGNRDTKLLKYDNRSKILSIETAENNKPTYRTLFSYNEFDRVEKKLVSRLKSDGIKEETVYTYSYTDSGKLLAEKISFPDGTERNIKRTYDKFGRLAEIKDTDKSVKYAYDKNSRLTKQEIKGIPVHYAYTKFGQLASKIMGDEKDPIATLKYTYAKDGTITGREVNGKMQNYVYDAKNQLLKVVDASGNTVESYTYDNAGNILEKTVNGSTTKYTYDKANQLVSATLPNGSVKKYAYDAAGRMISENSDDMQKSYTYAWLDKVVSLENNGSRINFEYYPDGQISQKIMGNNTEKFYWDGLALIKRDSTEYTNEPAVTGGNPVLANDKVMFNDLLGTTVGTYGKEYSDINRTAFGETSVPSDIDFFTGKPQIDGLGYSFLYRNYRPELSKWQTSDPLGYPDGWNNLAYCNNWVMSCIDKFGAAIWHIVDSEAVVGKGHSAMIVGNSQSGYDYYSYSSAGVEHIHRDSFSQVVGALQEARMSSGSSAYDKWQKWDTTSAQDTLAREQTSDEKWSGNNYDVTTNNCWLMVRGSLEDASCDVNTAVTTAPNENFDMNLPEHGGSVSAYNKNDTSLQTPE